MHKFSFFDTSTFSLRANLYKTLKFEIESSKNVALGQLPITLDRDLRYYFKRYKIEVTIFLKNSVYKEFDVAAKDLKKKKLSYKKFIKN